MDNHGKVQQFCIEMGNISNCQAHYDEIGPYCSQLIPLYLGDNVSFFSAAVCVK